MRAPYVRTSQELKSMPESDNDSASRFFLRTQKKGSLSVDLFIRVGKEQIYFVRIGEVAGRWQLTE